MLIRKMTEADLDQMAELEALVFSVPWSRQGFADTLYMDNVCFLVAKEAGEILGYCGLYMAMDEGEITNVAVKPEARRQSVADRLMERLLAEGKQRGIGEFYLEVRMSNLPAIRLYQKHGFKEVGIRRNFYEKPREDARVMRLCLEESRRNLC